MGFFRKIFYGKGKKRLTFLMTFSISYKRFFKMDDYYMY